MLFVFFPIAAIWLDRTGRVVDAVLARPFRPFYAPRARPGHPGGAAGTVEEVAVGDLLEFG